MYSEINTNEISVFRSLNLIPFNDIGISAGIIIGLNKEIHWDYAHFGWSNLDTMNQTNANISN
jgi:hypothetical protein